MAIDSIFEFPEFMDIEEIRVAAEKVMPTNYKDYVNNKGMEETLDADLAAWRELFLRPRALIDVSNIDTTVSVLGKQIALPIITAPFIGSSFINPEGEVATARASAKVDTIMTLSMNGHRGPEPVGAATTGNYWQQIYWVRDRSIVADVVARAVASGASALCLTVDLPILPGFPRTMRENFFSLFPQFDTDDHRFYVNQDYSDRPQGSTFPNPGVTWKDLEWFKSLSDLPIILKGIIREDDAIRARDHGAAGVIVSNHAGQGLRYSQPVAHALPKIVQAVGSDIEVFADSGIRSGYDVLRALALGAKAVLVGRPVLWGLAAGGSAGVERVYEILKSELTDAMAITGAAKIADIDASVLAPRRN